MINNQVVKVYIKPNNTIVLDQCATDCKLMCNIIKDSA